ncbi:MAG: Lrp/AsnC family transcriptional regulator [Pseudonocardia sp.]
MRLDRTDEDIIALLVDDARSSYAQLGARVGLSASAVKRRVDRLRAGGAITGFTVRLDPAALGWSVEGYIELYCRMSTSPETIRAAVHRFPEVVDASTVSGEADAVLRILAADMRHFEQVLEQIGAQPFVARTKSVLVLSPLLRRPATPASRYEVARESTQSGAHNDHSPT